MLIQFRQGLVQVQSPSFFHVTFPYVDLMVTDTNTIVAFAAGAKDYLYTEQASVTQAWGPLHLGRDQWLYWDIDVRSGRRTFGITLHEPVVSHTAPNAPTTDQHWFDLSSSNMMIWTGHGWSKRIRTFAMKLINGRIPVSMCINSPAFIGTQVGATGPAYAGHIMFDATTENALRDASGGFITTEDRVSTKSVSLSEVKLASIIIEGEAQQNMAAHTVVVFSEFGKIVHADQYTAEQTRHFGMIETSAVTGQTVQVTNHGMISSPDWDWTSAGVNALVYCDAAGALTTTPVIPGQIPIGEVLDKHTIILGSPIVQAAGGADVALATQSVFGISRLSVPAEDAGDPIVVGDNDPRLSNARPPAFHMHPIAQVIDLQDTLDGKVNKAGDTMTGYLELSADPVLGIQAATKHYVDNRVVRLSDLVNSDRSNRTLNSNNKQTWEWSIPGESVSWMDSGLVLKSTAGAANSNSYGSWATQGSELNIYAFNSYWDVNGAYDYDIQPITDSNAATNIVMSVTDNAFPSLYECRTSWHYGDVAPANNPNGSIPTGDGTVIPSGYMFIHSNEGYTGTKTIEMSQPYPTELLSSQAIVKITMIPVSTDGTSVGGKVGIRIGSDLGMFNGTPVIVDIGTQTITVGTDVHQFDNPWTFENGVLYYIMFTINDLQYTGSGQVNVNIHVQHAMPVDGQYPTADILQSAVTPDEVIPNAGLNKYQSFISTLVADVDGAGIAFNYINVNSVLEQAVDFRPSLLSVSAESPTAHAFTAVGEHGYGINVQASGRTMIGGGLVSASPYTQGTLTLTNRDSVEIATVIDGGMVGYQHEVAKRILMNPLLEITTQLNATAYGGTVRLRGGAATYADLTGQQGTYVSADCITADGAQIDLSGAANLNRPESPLNPGPVGGSALIRGGDATTQHANAHGGHVTIRGGVGSDSGLAGTVLIQSGRPIVDYTWPSLEDNLSTICTSAHFTETAIRFYTTVAAVYGELAPIVSIEEHGFTFGVPSDTGHAGVAGQVITHNGQGMMWADASGGSSAKLQTIEVGTPYFPI